MNPEIVTLPLTPQPLTLEPQTPQEEPRPLEPVTPILPSEALRLGRLTRPRKVNCNTFYESVGACALGAMAIGYGMPDPGDVGRNSSLELDHAAYGVVAEAAFGGNITHPDFARVWRLNDSTSDADGDAAVLAYLRERSL